MTDDEPSEDVEGDDDFKLRLFIAEKMADPDIDGRVLVSNMDAVYKWLKNGTVPKPPRKAIG